MIRACVCIPSVLFVVTLLLPLACAAPAVQADQASESEAVKWRSLPPDTTPDGIPQLDGPTGISVRSPSKDLLQALCANSRVLGLELSDVAVAEDGTSLLDELRLPQHLRLLRLGIKGHGNPIVRLAPILSQEGCAISSLSVKVRSVASVDLVGIGSCKSLRELSLDLREHLNAGAASAVAELDSLRALHLALDRAAATPAQLLELVGSLKALATLSLDECVARFSPAEWMGLVGPELQSLAIKGASGLTADVVRAWVGRAAFQSLNVRGIEGGSAWMLGLEGANISELCLGEFASAPSQTEWAVLKSLKALKRLSLLYCDSLGDALSACTGLELDVLSVAGKNLTAAECDAFRLMRVGQINISMSKLSEESLGVVLKTEGLRELSLLGSALPDDWPEMLRRLRVAAPSVKIGPDR